ncbi:MAG: DUF1223 domain-containing protein [Acidiferrobacterales bacterium]|nr:DUF1223 domain-containing protein [Acidiferrobacterales bacterium]
MKLIILIATSLALLFASQAFAQTFETSEEQVPLIELYTSEGCSSCPPADRWMTSLHDNQGLWKDFVPVSFHVDYWDYIGWPDRFASKEYSQRQRRYASELNEPTVYTPGMRKAGALWRNWRSGGAPKSTDPKNVGVFSLTINDSGTFNANFDATSTGDLPSQINIALLGLDLSSDVKRGENKGKILHHDFVVLGISTITSAHPNQWSGRLPKPSIEAPQYAIAAWVTHGQSLQPIQAVGGLLNPQLAFD